MNSNVSLVVMRLSHPDHDQLSLDQHYYRRSTTKNITDSDAFTKTPPAMTHLLKDVTVSDTLT
jgi:hypothetical protein